MPAMPESARERVIRSIVRENVPVVTPETPFGELPDLFAQTRCHVVVVVDPEQRPLGVITPVDLFSEVERHGPGSLADVGILDAAKARAIYLRADTRLSSALRLFAEQKPDCIIVVDETSGRLVGLVAHAELLDFLMA